MERVRLPVPVRWGDLDGYGHVNNVNVFRLLEEARISAFWRRPPSSDRPSASLPTAVLDSGPGAATHTVVARQEIEYLAPIGYERDGVVVELWIGHLGGASIDVCYEVVAPGTPDDDDAAGRAVYARATTTIVLLDAATGAPRRLTTDERAAWGPYTGEAIAHRRRA